MPGHGSSIAFAVNLRELDAATTVVAVEGELDLASAPSLKWSLTDLLDSGARRVVLDLSGVTFIDSTALGVLVGVHRTLADEGRLAIAGAHTEVQNIFELTGLDASFEMFPALDDAIAWVREGEAAEG